MKAEDLKRWPLLFEKFKKNIETRSIYTSYEEYMEDSDDIAGAFVWGNTKQNHSFWSALAEGDIETAKALEPKLFSIDNQVVEVNISSYELPEEVWTEHGEFTFSNKVDTMLGVMVSCLVCLDGVDKVSYRTSNYGGINFKIKGGDPTSIADIIYRYREVGTKSVGNLTCTFETALGETRQESFDYVY